LKLFFLGPPQIELDEASLELESRKGVALLAYLAVTGQSHSRDALSTLLWPDNDQQQARSYLRHALWLLKKALGDSWLEISREQVGLQAEADIWLDVHAFQQGAAAASGTDGDGLPRLAEAAELYRGDFLSGFTLADAPNFDEWQFFQTEDLRQRLAGALKQLVWGYSRQSNFEVAIPHARRWVALDPLHEPAQRHLMQLYGETDQKAAALRQYEEYAALLEKELGLPPEEETTTLYEAIKAKRIAEPFLKAKEHRPQSRPEPDPGSAEQLIPLSSPPPPLPFPESAFSAETEEAPFVGRQQELIRLNRLLEAALSRQNQIAFVIGPAGQGKTALLQAFGQQAQAIHPNLIVVGGNCNAYTGLGDPYLPFRQMLELLTGDIEAQAVAGTLHPERARRLGQIFPLTVQVLLERGSDLFDTFIPLPSLLRRAAAYAAQSPAWLAQLQTLASQRTNTPAQQSALFEQYVKVIQTLAGQMPLLLLLDDLQWADPGSVSLLFHLGRRLTGHRVLILGAYRPNEVTLTPDGAPHPLAQVVHKFQSDFGDIILDLSQTEGQTFVDDLLDSQPNRLGHFFRQTLYRQTGGHPLFTIELLRGMQERGDLAQDGAGVWQMRPSLNWNTLPARVEGAIAERIGRLAPPLQKLLQVASVEGEEFTAEVIAQALNLADHEVVGQLSRDLDKTHALVQALGTKRIGQRRLSRYRFRHILIQRYLYNLLDEVERVYQHERVGFTLEYLYGEQAAEVAVQLARHFEAAQLPEKAIGYLHLAGDQARRSTALNEAIRYYQAALKYWPNADEAGRAELLRKLGECQWMTGQAEDALKTFKEDYDLFEALDNLEGAGAIQRLMGRVYWEMGDREQSLRHYRRTLSLLKQGPESVELAWAISSISQMRMLANEYAQAIDWGERALALAGRLGAEAVTVHALNNVGTAYLNAGEPERGQAMLRESVRRALEANLPHDACRGRLNLGEGLAGLDYYEEARATFEELYAYAAHVSTALYAGSSLIELAQLDWLTGRWSDALARRQQILEWLERAQSQAYVEIKASSLFGQQHNDLGQAEVAYQILTQTLAKVRSFNELQVTAFHLAELARALVGLGSPEEAIEVVRELVAAVRRGGYDSRFSTLPLLKACHLFVGHTHLGPINEVMAALQQIERTNPRSHSRATVAALREGQGVALLRDTPYKAIEPLRQAVGLWQTLGRPYDQIRALNSLGQALSQTENGREAQATFAEAQRLIMLLVAQLEDAELKASFLNSPLVQGMRKRFDRPQP
jgi:DNA-binding SARP family transcriptional activator